MHALGPKLAITGNINFLLKNKYNIHKVQGNIYLKTKKKFEKNKNLVPAVCI